MINIDSFQELVESMDIIAENKFKTASQIYYCLVKRITSGSKCVIDFNNKEYIVPYFAGTPRPNKTYALFLPQNNMNQAFVIGEGGSGGGGGSGIAVQPDPPTGDELVWIDTDDPGTIHIIPEIDDNNVSTTDTWSSQKITSEISGLIEIGSTANGWSWVLYNDNTIDLYWNASMTITNYSASTIGGLYEFGPVSLPITLEAGYAFVAGCKIGNGISIVALCNPISGSRIDVIGQGNVTGAQACTVSVHLHGKKAV